MKTHTTKKTIWIKSLLLLPLLAVLIYSCSTVKALENHSTYEERKSEVPYEIITNKAFLDTLERAVREFISKNPLPVYKKQGDTIYFNNISYSQRQLDFFKRQSDTITLNQDNLSHSYSL